MTLLFQWNRQVEIQIKNLYLQIGIHVIGENFNIINENAATITNLLKYFTGNESDLDLNKGIYLYGDFGVGKTTILRIIRTILAEVAPIDITGKKVNPNGFLITSIEHIIDVYKEDGSLDYFGYRKETKPIHICINEFGKKLHDKIYGTDANQIVNSLFMIRYELFQKGYLTHVTSNYHPKSIDVEAIIIDRMIEMFNFIEIKGESLRK